MYGEVCAAAYVCFWPEADVQCLSGKEGHRLAEWRPGKDGGRGEWLAPLTA